MRLAHVAWIPLSLILLGPGAAFAQGGVERSGLWWGLGLAYGWTHVSCDICEADRGFGLSGGGRVGGTISSNVLMGAELNAWLRSEESVDELLGTFGLTFRWYPVATGSFYLKGGFHYVTYRIDDGEDDLTASAFGPQLGLGRDFHIGRRLSVQPYLNSIITLPNGELDINGDRQATGVSLSLVQVGLSVTRH